jgi:acyl-CoA thioester hydrolase
VASQKGAFVNLQNSRPIPIPEELKSKYLENQKGNLKDFL